MNSLIISRGCTPNKAYTSQGDYISGDHEAEAWVAVFLVQQTFLIKEGSEVCEYLGLAVLNKGDQRDRLLGMSQPVQINVMKYSRFVLASVQFCVQFHIDVLRILQHLWNNSSLIGIAWVSGLSTLKVTPQEQFTQDRGSACVGEDLSRSAALRGAALSQVQPSFTGIFLSALVYTQHLT